MKIVFMEDAWEDYLYWQQVDQAMLRKVNRLIKENIQNSVSGNGETGSTKGKFVWILVKTNEPRTPPRLQSRK